jgi:hypothetical protein
MKQVQHHIPRGNRLVTKGHPSDRNPFSVYVCIYCVGFAQSINLWSQKTPLLRKHIPHAGNIRRLAVSITIKNVIIARQRFGKHTRGNEYVTIRCPVLGNVAVTRGYNNAGNRRCLLCGPCRNFITNTKNPLRYPRPKLGGGQAYAR